MPLKGPFGCTVDRGNHSGINNGVFVGGDSVCLIEFGGGQLIKIVFDDK